MITTLVLNKRAEQGSLSDLGSRKKFVWVDCINPIEDELEVISEKTKIPLEELKEVIDEDERSRVVENDSYVTLIFRVPAIEKHETLTTALAVLFSKKWVITLRQRELVPLTKLMTLPDSAKTHLLEQGVSYFVYRLLDEVLLAYFSEMDRIEEQIDSIEARVFRKPERATVREIFAVKKTLIYFHKALAANREVITAIEKEYVTQIHKKDLKKFRNLYNDITELLDIEGTYRDILTGALDIYVSAVSNSLNIIMKKFTALASFVLIPTLISGIYGMNFNYMPELYWKYGYFATIGLMVLSVVALYIYFKKKKWL